jgi:phosphoglycerate dehydrogenase-like enzyme
VKQPSIPIHIKNNRSGERVFRITPELFREASDRHPEIAARIQPTIDFDLDHFDESIATAVALVTWDLPLENLEELAPNLRWIHVIGAGVEHLQPLDWLPPGVTLTNNRGVHAKKAGEYGLMALLLLNNAIPELIGAQQQRRFLECYTTSIAGKTLLVVGAGHMGRAVARQAQRFGLRTIGIRRHPQPTGDFDVVHGPDKLDELLPDCDFLLLALPATPETEGLIDARRLSLLRPGAGLINMGRAATLDHDALAEALTASRLAGAVLDVFDPEPLPPSSPLWATPNLIITPHMSSDDRDAYVPLTLDLVFENLRCLIAGQPLRNQVVPELGY